MPRHLTLRLLAAAIALSALGSAFRSLNSSQTEERFLAGAGVSASVTELPLVASVTRHTALAPCVDSSESGSEQGEKNASSEPQTEQLEQEHPIGRGFPRSERGTLGSAFEAA